MRGEQKRIDFQPQRLERVVRGREEREATPFPFRLRGLGCRGCRVEVLVQTGLLEGEV